jgi:hypothetical protein
MVPMIPTYVRSIIVARLSVHGRRRAHRSSAGPPAMRRARTSPSISVRPLAPGLSRIDER